MKVTYNTIMTKIAALTKQAEMLAKGATATKEATAERIVHRRRKPEAKFVDPVSGTTWSGRGKTPLWMKAAMAEGKTREDFDVTKVSTVVAATTEAVPSNVTEMSKVVRTRRKPEAKFVDPVSGNAWTGRGKTPVWLREALNAGKSKDQFSVAA